MRPRAPVTERPPPPHGGGRGGGGACYRRLVALREKIAPATASAAIKVGGVGGQGQGGGRGGGLTAIATNASGGPPVGTPAASLLTGARRSAELHRHGVGEALSPGKPE